MVAVQVSQSVLSPKLGLSQWLRSALGSRLLSMTLSLSLAVIGTASATVVQAADGLGMAQTIPTVSTVSSVNAADGQLRLASSLPSLPNDGVYVYGQSAQPDELGRAYLVFEVSQGKVVGGFYMPNSSFDCFSGSIGAGKLALTIVDSYDRTHQYPYSVALAVDTSVASNNPEIPNFSLEGYQRINTIGSTDQHILGVCKADFAK